MQSLFRSFLVCCAVISTNLSWIGVSTADNLLSEELSRQAITAIDQHSYKKAVGLVYEALVRGEPGAEAIVQMVQIKCAELPKGGGAYRRYCLPAFNLAARAKAERETRIQAQKDLAARKARAEAAAKAKAVAEAEAIAKKKAREEAARKALLADPLRNAFLALSKPDRRTVQQTLKDLGFYRSRVDGLYGRGTRRALDDYATQMKREAHDQADEAPRFINELLASAQALAKEPPKRYADRITAAQYLQDVKAFVQERKGALDAVLLSQIFQAAVREVEMNNYLRAGSQFAKLVEHTDSKPAFVRFEANLQAERAANESNKRKELLGLLDANIANIKAKLKADPFNDNAKRLAELLGEYEQTPEELGSVALGKRNEALALALEQLDIEAARNSVDASERSTVSPSPLSALLEPNDARAFMKDVRAFGSLNPGRLDPILIARHFAAANAEIESGEFKNAGASYLQLAQTLLKDAQFSAYHEKQKAIRIRELPLSNLESWGRY